MAVAAAAFSALCDDDAFSIRDQVREDFTCLVIVDHGADRQRDDDGFSPAPRAVRAATGFSVLRLVMSLVAEVEEGGEPVGGCEHDIAAVSAVSSVRAAAGNEHFPAETAAAVAAATGFDGNSDFIDEHRIPSSVKSERASPGGVMPGTRPCKKPSW